MNATTIRTSPTTKSRAKEAALPRRGPAAWLRTVGLEGTLATKLATAMRGEGSLQERFRNGIEDLVPMAPFGATNTSSSPRVVAVVGPSGVGKTTTVAKLAARARIEGRSVALISCDAFRVGAIDQLERYAELLSAEMFVARTPVELAEVLDDLLERPEGPPEVVFVDTSGRPPTSQSPEHALAGWIARAERTHGKREGGPTLEVLLCMTASTRASDADRITRTFAPAEPTAVVVTKTDETCAPAALVHGPHAAKLPLAVVCHGPRVPEDVRDADPDVVAALFEGLSSADPEPGTRKEGTS